MTSRKAIAVPTSAGMTTETFKGANSCPAYVAPHFGVLGVLKVDVDCPISFSDMRRRSHKLQHPMLLCKATYKDFKASPPR